MSMARLFLIAGSGGQIKPEQRIPPRKTLREWVQSYEQKNAFKAYALFIGDCVMFVTASVLAVVAPWYLQLACVPLLALLIARLFIIGHDACHGSYTDSRRQNRWIGKIAFLPSLTPYRWWEVGHNMAHHGFGNLAGKDHVWVPLSPAQYQALMPRQQRWYRLTRSVFGAGPYYLHKWGMDLLRLRKPQSRAIEWDTVLVLGFAGIWIASVAALAAATGNNVWIALTLAIVLPFIGWNYLMGLVIYLHHTHPGVKWYQDQAAWIASHPYISATVHVRFPQWFSTALHHIMEHAAHHLNTGIPLYNLHAAQARLEAGLGDAVVVQGFSWAWYRRCVSTCKVYDFERGRWVGFGGDG